MVNAAVASNAVLPSGAVTVIRCGRVTGAPVWFTAAARNVSCPSAAPCAVTFSSAAAGVRCTRTPRVSPPQFQYRSVLIPYGRIVLVRLSATTATVL